MRSLLRFKPSKISDWIRQSIEEIDNPFRQDILRWKQFKDHTTALTGKVLDDAIVWIKEKKYNVPDDIFEFVEFSRKIRRKTKIRRRNIIIGLTLAVFLIMSGFTFWALTERSKAIDQIRGLALNGFYPVFQFVRGHS